MPTWNPQQLKAIETKQKNILVSASAGAGKTTVLIARLVDLVIRDRIHIERILAMTFTEAAANEMKKRLAAELHALHKQTEDEQERTYIAEQLTAISTAHISTIHSFCLSILQEFYYIIDLSAKRIANIMDKATSAQANDIAMQEVFALQYEKQEEAFYILSSMFSARPESDTQLRDAILTLAKTANAQPDPDAWLDQCLSTYKPYQHIDELPSDIQVLFFDDLRVQSAMYQGLCEELHGLYTTMYQEELKKGELMRKKCEALPSLFTALDAQDYPAYKEAFIALCHIVVPPSPDKEDKRYAKLRKDVLAQEDAMLARLYDEYIFLQDIKDLSIPITKLVEMCRDYRRIYARYKKEHDCIDFDDMEHFAIAILKTNDHQVAKHYQHLFDEIMVDEFQDSNDVQNELVTLICRENNVFRVGDIKQSIYGFRHAKPQLMRGLIEQRGEFDEVIYLSNNYRSKKMIVDFNNQLFMELMNLDGFDGSYRKEDDVETGIPAQLEDNYPIVFHALDYGSINEEMDMHAANNELKASYIADQIIRIREDEQRKWKDFVVLVRSNARKEDMKRIFDTLHIPYFIDVKTGFYQSNAVQIVLSCLRSLVNPHDEISFVATMISPLFQLSVQEIAEIKMLKEPTQSYYAYLLAQQHPILEHFEHLRSCIYHEGICEVLNLVYETKNFYTHHTTVQEKTNLDLLFENAATFEQKEGKGMLAFIKSIDIIKDAQTAEAIPIGSDEDVVRVMSIHQSKGLQFPVVFLWSNSKQTPIEFKELFICDSDLGIGMKHMQIEHRFMRPTIQRIAIEHKKDREELEEEMRILYVATTRAQQQMHIVDGVKSLDDYASALSTTSVYQRGGYTAWVLMSKLAEHNPLFNIKPVTHAWKSEVQDTKTEGSKQRYLYQGSDENIAITTPSIIKTKQSIPTLSFQNQTSMRHGTNMHHIIEQLATTPWDEKDILALAPNLSDSDLQALLHLQNNALYQRACRYQETHHEVPFMVKDETQILHGFIDFVAIDQDIILIDFKTDVVKHEHELNERYTEQLRAYEKAMRILYPNKQISTYIYSLTLHKEVVV